MPCREGRGLVSRLSAEEYYTKLAEGLLSQGARVRGARRFCAWASRAVAALGQLANPIVSFNIEPVLVLFMLARRPGGAPEAPLGSAASGDSEVRVAGRVRSLSRIVYHPHGLATGGSVMTERQYKANEQSLAFTLAINVAFANTLLIVGMSLNDDYLRQHIEAARDDLKRDLLVDSSFPEELADWAARHRITTVRVDWGEFLGLLGQGHLPLRVSKSRSTNRSCVLGGTWRWSVRRRAEEGSMSRSRATYRGFHGGVPPACIDRRGAGGGRSQDRDAPCEPSKDEPRDIEADAAIESKPQAPPPGTTQHTAPIR